jgi:hypothetical protein
LYSSRTLDRDGDRYLLFLEIRPSVFLVVGNIFSGLLVYTSGVDLGYSDYHVKPYPYPVLVVLSLIRADQSTLLYPVELPLIRAVPDDAQF